MATGTQLVTLHTKHPGQNSKLTSKNIGDKSIFGRVEGMMSQNINSRTMHCTGGEVLRSWIAVGKE